MANEKKKKHILIFSGLVAYLAIPDRLFVADCSAQDLANGGNAMLNLRLFGGPPSADHSQTTPHGTRFSGLRLLRGLFRSTMLHIDGLHGR